MNVNILELVLLIVLIIAIVDGYKKGFIRVLFSIASWIVAIILVITINPVITKGIEEYTKIDDRIYTHVEEYFEENGLDIFREGDDEKDDSDSEEVKVNDGEEISDAESEEKSEAESNEISHDEMSDSDIVDAELLQKLGLDLPESVLDFITEGAIQSVDDVSDEMIEALGIYQMIAKSVTHFIVQGIAFIFTWILVCILVAVIDNALGIFNHLPLLGNLNKMAGAFGGAAHTLLGIWIFFYIISLGCTGTLGRVFLPLIRESEVLSYLYHNNMLVTIVLRFIKKF